MERAGLTSLPSPSLRLSDAVQFALRYSDETPFGSCVSSKAQSEIARLAGPVVPRLKRTAPHDWTHIATELFSASRLGGLFATPRELKQEVLFPPRDRVKPATLEIFGPSGQRRSVNLSADLSVDLSPRLAEWQRGASEPSSSHAKELWRALHDMGALVPAEEPPRHRPRGATLVGHATVLICDGSDSILFDPFVIAQKSEFPSSYQPFSAQEMAADAIFVTHGHPDHFSPESLLRFDPDTPIFVPDVDRESLLAPDMHYRLTELGFRKVTRLRWFSSTNVGAMTVTALPFYGEQPTTADSLHPETANHGNTYFVATSHGSYAILADSGTDARGSSVDLASSASTSLGAANVVFGGYRGWSLYPLQYLASSVPQYLLFVPPSLRLARQTIMNDASDLLDTAERWMARLTVPYADGGAPWYWTLGLGPNLETGTGNVHLDPLPETVRAHSLARATLAGKTLGSPTAVQLLHPGETCAPSTSEGTFRVETHFGRRWPYKETNPAPGTLAGKRLLLRKLAQREITRLGMTIGSSDVQYVVDQHRRLNGMVRAEDLHRWLDDAKLDPRRFTELMAEWAAVLKLQQHYCTDPGELDEQVRFETMGIWKAGV